MPRSTLPSAPQGLQHYWLRRDWGWLHLTAGGRGPALWLVHGLGGSGQDYYAMAPYLSGHFTLLIPDLPGFGFSDKPDVAYSPAFFAEELAQVTAELGLKQAHWLGHSMGGHIVLLQAVERPGLVSRAVGVCPSGGQLRSDWRRELLLTLFARPDDHLRLYHPALLSLAVRWCYGDKSHPSRKELTKRAQELWDGLEGPLVERALVRSARALLSQPVWPSLNQLQAPVLLVGGERDRVITQRDIGRLLGHLPYGTPYELLPCGHLPVYTLPEELASLVSAFLRDKD
ncbi:MAG: alpha/beta hydrolase [Desulfarculaceae bacterium]|nr:alpha/beta hydrolase [Desulfarculaceae bacterium]MCF8073442.1 alpha/beta hydrolase [Desulfarculaceae bacterium]MCF8100411.1 alpha/beta hydrolase [Desulfarculaceae bacterium]MCF8115853.1 alpha/beta hydrolase [Desulfarculaceae bacterium]